MNCITSIIREVNNPMSKLSDATVYRGLVSIVERYNTIARNKGLPTKKIPVYNKHMNDDLLKRFMLRILKDITRIKNIKENKRDILTGAVFGEDDTFTDGIWTYTREIVNGNNIVKVTLNVDKFKESFTEASVELDYDHMPYEKVMDTDGNEYSTNSYELMFANLPTTVTSLTIDNWTNSNVIDIHQMFSYCSSLTSLKLGPNFDTSKVTEMNSMFEHCSNITSSPLGLNFNTVNVTNMRAMFTGCSSLKSLPLGPNFNTSNVKNMGMMFNGCSALEELNLGIEFDTFNVTDMESMFNGCTSLVSLKLGPNFNASNVEKMDSMFNGCTSLKSLTLYQSADNIIKWLPSATWNTKDGDITYSIVTSAGTTDPTWNPTPTWNNPPLTLSRTIQS